MSKLLLRFLFFVSFVSIPFYCSAQEEYETLQNTLESLAYEIPQDKIFLHTDRNLYMPGDTIYFQMYIEDRFTQKFETSSLSSFVILCGREGELLDSARFRIDYSLAPGWLVVPAYCKSGYYCLKSFTSRMQNYDPSYAYSSWIRVEEPYKEDLSFEYSFDNSSYSSGDTIELTIGIKDSKREALKSTSFSYSLRIDNSLEETYRSRTTRDGTSLLRIYLPDSLANKRISVDISVEKGLGTLKVLIPQTQERADISFLPEGGTFIHGHSQRLAFNAVSASGRQLYLNGVIIDDMGRFVDSVKSGSLGPGIVEVRPEKGRNYYAVFEEYKDVKWPLPEASDIIPAIKVKQFGNIINVEIFGEDRSEQYFLALAKNYNIVAFLPLSLDSYKRVKFLTDSIPPGMANIILFNKELVPIAERSIFIPKRRETHINFETEFDFYLPGQETNLEIDITNSTDNNSAGLFSIAVLDSGSALSPQLYLKSVEDVFLFEEDFYDRVPRHIKILGLATISDEEIDQLLMTFGWSSYKWDREDNIGSIKINNYDQYNIEIWGVLLASRREKINKTKDPLFVLSIEEPSLINLSDENDGTYSLDISSIPSLTNSIILVPNYSVKRMARAANLRAVINRPYVEGLKEVEEDPNIKEAHLFSNTKEHNIDLDSINIIRGINVYAKRKPAKKYVNEYEFKYMGMSTKTIHGLAVESAMSFEDLLRRLSPSRLDPQQKRIYFRPIRSVMFGIPPALFVLNGVPQGTEYGSLTNLDPTNIHSLSVLKGIGGSYIYGEEARGGVVFIETKLSHIGDEYEVLPESSKYGGDLRKLIQIFRPAKEFYNPPQGFMQDDPEYWIRPTLYWNSETFYDGNNPVKLSYYNHQKKGIVYIIVNGVSSNGEPISGLHKYLIK